MTMEIKRITDYDKVNGTSHCGLCFYASTDQIIAKVGEPDARGDESEKVTREWDLELEDGTTFTIYDWKEYREYDDDEVVEWHIGTHWNDKAAPEKVTEALKEVGLCK